MAEPIRIITQDQIKREEYFGKNFFATSATWNIHGSSVSIDFMCQAPRVSSSGPAEVAEHNVVIMDLNHAKAFAHTLKSWIDQLESQFGQIEQPVFVKKFEDNIRENMPSDKSRTSKPNYLG